MQIVGINIFKRRIIKSIILENNLWHNQNRMNYTKHCNRKAIRKAISQGKLGNTNLSWEIAYKQMNTDYTATRMLGYLYRISDPRPEDVVDEMLAILSDRNAIIQKKELEHAQATINKVYREGL